MGSEWKTYKLGELTKWSSGGTPSKSNESFWGGCIPWISASSMGGSRYSDSKLKITESGLLSGSKLAQKGSILLLVRGSILHQKIQVGIAERDLSFNQDVKCLVPVSEEVDAWYLLYWLIANENFLLGKVESTGIGAGKLDTKLMQELEVKVPPKQERLRITAFAKAIDDKIQLNRETNQTLEAMAQALFKSWFVDFDPVFDNAIAHNLAHNKDPLHNIPEPLLPHAERRLDVYNVGRGSARQSAAQAFHHLFPQTFEQSDEPSVGIQGWVPKGWGSGNLLKSVDLVGGGTPKTKVEEYWNGDIPWFSVVDAPNDSDIFVIDTHKKVTQLGVDNSSTKILRKGTTIISARGTVGKCALVGVPMAMNQSCYGVQGLKGFTDEYVYYLVRFRVSDLQQRGHGSVFNTITKDTFESITSAIPAESVMASFSKILKPSFDKVLKNIEQSKELESLRDTLLPKLISGELRIPDAQQSVEVLIK